MTFESILFAPEVVAGPRGNPVAPDYFTDLNLDQLVQAITANKADYDLVPFFQQPLASGAAIVYRQAVMRDLEQPEVRTGVQQFASEMRAMHAALAQAEKLYYAYQKKWWFLHAVATYCGAVEGLLACLRTAVLQSAGMQGLRDFLAAYTQSAEYVRLITEVGEVQGGLAAVRYTLQVRGNQVIVRNYAGESDYSAEITATFDRFRSGESKDYRVTFTSRTSMNHVEAQIVDRVARLNPAAFAALDAFFAEHQAYLNATIRVFEREIQFYVAYLALMAYLRATGQAFCYPEVSAAEKAMDVVAGYDLMLAVKLAKDGAVVVTNDFYLSNPERIIVVSGPNQGGKTTFARMFGQLHYLACLGLPVPAQQARLFLFDQMFTHFERSEDIQNLRGKLKDDLVRIHAILAQATPNSIVILNEIFTSTTLRDAIFLGRKILAQMIDLDLLCVCVTFVDEWAEMGPKTVSMVAAVDDNNLTERTFKLTRKPPEGLAYAQAIVKQHRLTYADVVERIAE